MARTTGYKVKMNAITIYQHIIIICNSNIQFYSICANRHFVFAYMCSTHYIFRYDIKSFTNFQYQPFSIKIFKYQLTKLRMMEWKVKCKEKLSFTCIYYYTIYYRDENVECRWGQSCLKRKQVEDLLINFTVHYTPFSLIHS